MTKAQIIEHIKSELRQGATKKSIVASMTAGGWNLQDIEEAFDEASKDFKQLKSSESFRLVSDDTGKYYFWKTLKVFLLLVIIVLCFLFYLGG